jgi:PIN domain nuclease of toxin-antitoxin system
VILVFDASSLLAYLLAETGWQAVESLLNDEDNACYAHALNLHEVYRAFGLKMDRTAAAEAIQKLYDAGLTSRPDMDEPLWKDAADLVVTARQAPKATLATGDAFGMALARRLGAEFVSAERKEIDRLVPLGFCPIRFVR